MKQNRKPRYESMQICPPDFLIKPPKTNNEEKPASSTMLLGKLDIYMQKTATASISFILYKYQLKVE
jgi:hypothetical protein